MAIRWNFHSETFGNCNCAVNCGCQFNLPSTYGFCQFVEGGRVMSGDFDGVQLDGLHWAFMIKWPGEIAEGGGTRQIIIDEQADAAQRAALGQIVGGTVGAPGSNHFSVFYSCCSDFLETLYLPIEYEIDIASRSARLEIPGLVKATGTPIVNQFDGSAFHIALARPTGSFEFTYAELGTGTSRVDGTMEMAFDGSYAQFNEHNYNQDGLIASP